MKDELDEQMHVPSPEVWLTDFCFLTRSDCHTVTAFVFYIWRSLSHVAVLVAILDGNFFQLIAAKKELAALEHELDTYPARLAQADEELKELEALNKACYFSSSLPLTTGLSYPFLLLVNCSGVCKVLLGTSL